MRPILPMMIAVALGGLPLMGVGQTTVPAPPPPPQEAGAEANEAHLHDHSPGLIIGLRDHGRFDGTPKNLDEATGLADAALESDEPIPQAVLARLKRLFEVARVVDLKPSRYLGGLAVAVRFASGASMSEVELDALIDQLQSADREVQDVAYVVPNRHVDTDSNPTDPDWPRMWAHQPYEGLGAFPGAANFTGAWSTATGQDVVVAVVDSGVGSNANTHPDLVGRLLPGFDFIAGDYQDEAQPFFSAGDGDGPDADPTDPGNYCDHPDFPKRDSDWHGTAVAGLIAAVPNNGLFTAGSAPNVKILPVRALGRCGGNSADVIRAMRWAAGLQVDPYPNNSTPAKIINLSLGAHFSLPCDPAMQAAIDEVTRAGALVIAAAGNEGSSSQYPQGTGAVAMPASCNGVLAVAAHNSVGDLAAYSNFGTEVALTAPAGGSCKSTRTEFVACSSSTAAAAYVSLKHSSKTTLDAGSYNTAAFAGTSAAAPLVAATAALMLQKNPGLLPAQLRSGLVAAARTHDWPKGSWCDRNRALNACGEGMLSASEALNFTDLPSLDIASTAVLQDDGSVAGGNRITFSANSAQLGDLTLTWQVTLGGARFPIDSPLNGNSITVALPPSSLLPLRVSLTGVDRLGRSVEAIPRVLRINSPPTMEALPALSASTGGNLVVDLRANDPDGQVVRYRLLTAEPAGLQVVAHQLQWSGAQAGRWTVRVQAEDGLGLKGNTVETTLTVGEALSVSSPFGSAGSGGGGAGGWGFLGALGLLAALRRRVGGSAAR